MSIKSMVKAVACLAAWAISGAAAAIDPPSATGSIIGPTTFSFQTYASTGLPAPVGAGRVNVNSLFYIDEKVGTYDFGKGEQAVKSWYIFFDPACQAVIDADITFSTTILGVLTKRGDLASTNAEFGQDLLNANGPDYRNRAFTGTERKDLTTWSLSDPGTLHIHWTASNPGDHIRVFTALNVPEPQTYALLLAGLGLVAVMARRRKASVA